jgi:6-pyruvoyltetrahydropterin/6-carboxytetrahydropterin synthase
MPDADGMIMDLGFLEAILQDARDALDHRFLDEVPGLSPATMENLCLWIWQRLHPRLPALVRVTVYRDSNGETCVYYGPQHER